MNLYLDLLGTLNMMGPTTKTIGCTLAGMSVNVKTFC